MISSLLVMSTLKVKSEDSLQNKIEQISSQSRLSETWAMNSQFQSFFQLPATIKTQNIDVNLKQLPRI